MQMCRTGCDPSRMVCALDECPMPDHSCDATSTCDCGKTVCYPAQCALPKTCLSRGVGTCESTKLACDNDDCPRESLMCNEVEHCNAETPVCNIDQCVAKTSCGPTSCPQGKLVCDTDECAAGCLTPIVSLDDTTDRMSSLYGQAGGTCVPPMTGCNVCNVDIAFTSTSAFIAANSCASGAGLAFGEDKFGCGACRTPGGLHQIALFIADDGCEVDAFNRFAGSADWFALNIANCDSRQSFQWPLLFASSVVTVFCT